MGTNPVTPPEYNSMRKHSVLNVRKVWLGICLWVCVHVCVGVRKHCNGKIVNAIVLIQ